MRSDLQRALANQPVVGRGGDDRRRAHPVHRAHAAAAGRARRTATTTTPTTTDERRTGLIWVAVVVALLLVVGAGAFFIWRLGSGDSGTKKVPVPNLVGLTPSQANKQLNNPTNCSATNTCNVYLVQNADTPTTPGPCDTGETPTKENVICKVTDQAGQTVPANAEVTQGSQLQYSLYKKDVTNVPYVKGLSFQAGERRAQGCRTQGAPGQTDQHLRPTGGRRRRAEPAVQQGCLARHDRRAAALDRQGEAAGRAWHDARRRARMLNRAQFTNIGPDQKVTGSTRPRTARSCGWIRRRVTPTTRTCGSR